MTISEREKMLLGQDYNPMDKELVALRLRARRMTERLNSTPMSKHGDRKSQLQSLFAYTGSSLFIESPFHCDYGSHISVGEHFYANFGCVILDAAEVKIGNHCKFGQQVGVYTATHPTDATARNAGTEFAKPITLGNNVWIGGHATLLPGITLGDNTVVAAGAVVTKSVEKGNVLLAGNPAKIIKHL